MAYESIDRLKKYMQKKIDAIVTGEKVTFNINAHQLLNEINEMERKAKAWEELKEEMRSMFVWGSDLPKGTPSKYMNEAYGIVFKKMCELDNTNEFSNLLNDLGDE